MASIRKHRFSNFITGFQPFFINIYCYDVLFVRFDLVLSRFGKFFWVLLSFSTVMAMFSRVLLYRFQTSRHRFWRYPPRFWQFVFDYSYSSINFDVIAYVLGFCWVVCRFFFIIFFIFLSFWYPFQPLFQSAWFSGVLLKNFRRYGNNFCCYGIIFGHYIIFLNFA